MCHYSKISRCLIFRIFPGLVIFGTAVFGAELCEVASTGSDGPEHRAQSQSGARHPSGRGSWTWAWQEPQGDDFIVSKGMPGAYFNWMYSNNISYMHMQMYITTIFQTKPFPRDFFFACSMIHIYSICILHMYCLPFKPLSCSHLKSKNHWKFCSESSVELRSKFAQRSDPAAKSPTQSAAKSTGQLSWSIALRRASSRGVRVGSWQLWSCFQM